MTDKQQRTQEQRPTSSGPSAEEPSEERRPISADAATSKSDGDAETAGLADLTQTVATKRERILHPEEIFGDVPENPSSKRQAFSDYNKAVKEVEHAEAQSAGAGTDREQAAAERRLNAARRNKDAVLARVKAIIVERLVRGDRKRKALTQELQEAKRKHAGAERLVLLRSQLATYERDLRVDAVAKTAAMTHTEVGHETESVFEPVETEVHTFEVTFPGGESERLRDRSVSYATVAPEGVEGVQSGRDRRAARGEVEATMEAAGLSAAKRKILQTISGFEGGFDAVNTYDKKQVTWGFVQWAGGAKSDLTDALSFIKRTHRNAFRDQLQRYGIDVVADTLVVKRQEGDVLKGNEAAAAIQADPKLAAVLMHAGQDPEIQKGEVGAAAAIEIDKMMAKITKAGKHEVAFDKLFTSEYGVGLLANTAVHRGPKKAQRAIGQALASYLKEHPYEASEEWFAGAEAACIDALAALDAQRAVTLGKLDQSRGSYQR